MIQQQPLREVADLTDPKRNLIFNMTVADARARVGSGDCGRVAEIEGHFALLSQQGHLVHMARSIGLPMRYFIAKRTDGPALVVSDRIDAIREWLRERGLIGDLAQQAVTILLVKEINKTTVILELDREGSGEHGNTGLSLRSQLIDQLTAKRTLIGENQPFPGLF